MTGVFPFSKPLQGVPAFEPALVPAPRRSRRILVVNAKGGCGKTTIATNIASYYAARKWSTAILDHDAQGSSLQWLRLRDEARGAIHGVAAYQVPGARVTRTWQLRVPPQTERAILDAPAGVHGAELIDLVRDVDAILIPVLPSPIDIHAAAHFIEELLLVAKVRTRRIRLGVVANRVRPNTRIYQALEKFLAGLDIPLVARLRDTLNYVQAAELGIGIHDLQQRQTRRDLEQWKLLMRWLEDEV